MAKISYNHRKNIIFLFAFVLIAGLFWLGYQTLYVIFSNSSEKVTILDRNGDVLVSQTGENDNYQTYQDLGEINPYFKDIFIAVEDKRFYWNRGIDIPRTLKCSSTWLGSSDKVCGASTITQQLVKNKLENNLERSIWNKLNEIGVSFVLDIFVPKNWILEHYLNSVYFSNLRYGVESASFGYFGKPSSELDLAQVSFLVAIPNSPTLYNPYQNFNEVKERQKIILDLLVDQNYISQDEANAAYAQSLELQSNYGSVVAPHFINMVGGSGYGVRGSEDIYTTIDSQVYQKIQTVIEKHMSDLEKKNATNAAVVVLNRDGEILSLHGSKDFFADDIDGQVNATQSLRNPGSTLKPFTYALALENNFSAATQILDEEQIIFSSNGERYFPKNYDDDEHGWVTVREALANSYNIPAVITLNEVGVQNFYRLSDKIGLEEIRAQDADIAATLGGTSLSLLDITNAYRVFQHNGSYPGSYKIFLNSDSKSKEDDVFGPESAQISYIISDILSDNDARRYSFGSFSKLNTPFISYSKTGTAQDFRDSWTIGYTNEYVVGVWVGNNDNSSMDGVNGVQGAGLIWHDVMEVVNGYYSEKEGFDQFPVNRPEGVIGLSVCSNQYLETNCNSFVYDELFIEGKTFENPNVIRRLGKIEEKAITILDPFDKDTYFYQDNLRIPIKFKSNNFYEKYVLLVNGQQITETTSNSEIWWEFQPGEFIVQIIGVDSNAVEVVSSEEVRVFVESN